MIKYAGGSVGEPSENRAQEAVLLAHERARTDTDLPAKVKAFAAAISASFDRRPVTREEWDWACGDEE